MHSCYMEVKDSKMTREDQEWTTASPTERLIQHLQHQPQDLIDARNLMIRFQASAEDFQ